MNRNTALTWTERALLAVGVVLALWAGATLTENMFFRSLPAPTAERPETPARPLPGEGGQPVAPPATRVSRGQWLAKLEAPSVHLTSTVLEGSDDDTLARAAGHIEETALPGGVGNVGIAGHRDTTFRAVRDLKTGDPLVLTTANRVFTYRITSLTIVNPEDVYVLDPSERAELTLVTCYPFTFIGHAPQRYIVKAALVEQVARGN